VKKIIFNFAWFFLCFINIAKVSVKAQNIDIYYDFVQFAYSQDSTLLEINYSFLDTNLNYKDIEDNNVQSKVAFKATFTHLQTGVSENYTWENINTKVKGDSLNMYSLFGVEKIILPTGNYKVNIVAYDENNLSNKNYSDLTENIYSFEKDQYTLSHILLANVIEQVNQKTRNWAEMFKKGNYYVIPNPANEYSSRDPNLRFYFEIYHPTIFNAIDRNKNEYSLVVSILDAANRELLRTPLKLLLDSNDLSKILNVPLDLFPTGVYYLRVSLIRYNEESKYKVVDETFKKFYYYNQFIKPQLVSNFTEDQLFEMSEFNTMDLSTVDKEFKKASVIAKPIEVEQWDKITTLQGKQRYLYRFWKVRDTDTSTIVNERKIEYDDLVNYANTYFTYGNKKDGWNTERGRILLKYGYPTQRDRYTSNGDERAYEDWFYGEIQGGVHFQFVDISGYGNYILVNSTASGEISDPNWYDEYVKNQKQYDPNSSNSNSPFNPIK
jgi:GWxTD domain-containing protein